MFEENIQAIGGFYEEGSDNRIYPGTAKLKRDAGLLQGTWKEGPIETSPNRQRTGYMTAMVPQQWLKCQ